MKKMTVETKSPILVRGHSRPDIQSPSKLFNFDRLYEHCLKKLNKNLYYYEKDVCRPKDKKYYELKEESRILTSELKSMRRNMLKKKDSKEGNLGVIGSYIEVRKAENA